MKAHATEEMVAKGIITERANKCDYEADYAAERGADRSDRTTSCLGKFYALRHENYKNSMKPIQSFIIKARRAEREIREQIAREKQPFRVKGEKENNIAAKIINNVEVRGDCSAYLYIR